MLTAYWEMQYSPFSAQPGRRPPFESEDYRQATARLKHLCEVVKGFGLFTGIPGTGKTFTISQYAGSLNPALYKVVYLPLSSVTALEFYRAIALGLGVVPAHKKIDLFNSIQERIASLSKERRITTVIICDEGQYLNAKILNDLKIITNFNMDAERHAAIVLAGQQKLANALSMAAHEALAQRILINYSFTGLSKDEMREYIGTRLEACGAREQIFAENAIEAIWGCCGGAPRVVNSLAEKCLLIGFQKTAKAVDAEIVRLASSELSLV